jgi:hypothetical protein
MGWGSTVVLTCCEIFVLGPRGIQHNFIVVSEQARLLVMTTPSGFENLVRAAGEPASEVRIPGSMAPPDRAVFLAQNDARATSRTRYARSHAGYLRDIGRLSRLSTSPPPLRHAADLRVLACSPNGIRTRASTLRGWCPRPLDDGTGELTHDSERA